MLELVLCRNDLRESFVTISPAVRVLWLYRLPYGCCGYIACRTGAVAQTAARSGAGAARSGAEEGLFFGSCAPEASGQRRHEAAAEQRGHP